jgi:hypothetical protein
MGRLATAFYKELYTSEGTRGMDLVLQTVPIKVLREMNDRFLLPFSGDEVKRALLQMFPTKAPGPDGFPAHFFQRNWSLCGGEVTMMVLRILKGEEDPTVVNDTFIVLIPMVVEPEDLGQFRPINHCNVTLQDSIESGGS